MLDNGADVTIKSSYNETGSIVLGSGNGTGTLTVASSGELRIVGNNAIEEGSGGGVLLNSGTIEKTAGSSLNGTTFLQTGITNTGVIDAAAGTIDFNGPNGGQASVIGGTLTGDGTVAFSTGLLYPDRRNPDRQSPVVQRQRQRHHRKPIESADHADIRQ